MVREVTADPPIHDIAIKRAYEPAARGDGVRVLVDRLWPRGLRKQDARFDQWRKDLSPSTELRKFYGHRPERFPEFRRRYLNELRRREAAAAVSELIALLPRRPVTLITAAKDAERSEAAVLADHVRRLARRRTLASATTERGARKRTRSIVSTRKGARSR
jgi:uncharacterized protein YeaO (DUF488 family)